MTDLKEDRSPSSHVISQITSMIESFGLGAMTGLGSLIFSCTAYAKLQNDSQALDAAIALSKVVNSDVITKESCADVMTGLAGLLIAIVELEQHYPQQMLRDNNTCSTSVTSRTHYVHEQ